MADRTRLVPPHEGRNVFPWNPLFTQLLRYAHQETPRLAIRDVVAGTEADYLQLISDVLHMRERLQLTLPHTAREKLSRDEEVFVSVLASGGYEYTVGVLAITACGAAVVPISVALSPKEATYYASKSHSVAVIHAAAYTDHARAVVREVDRDLATLSILPSCFTPRLDPASVFISSDRCPDPNHAGVIIFTSGTTGPPKAAVMRRKHSFDEAQGVADFYGITPDDVLLHCLPVHHATGIGMMFYPFLYAGACIEFRSGGFDPAWTWERFRRQGLTFFSAVPTIYMRMKRFYEEDIAGRPDRERFLAGARSLKVCMCGTSALPKPIDDFWAEILGKKIMLRYGGTEFGAVLRHRPGDGNTPDGSVGQILPGVAVKLSQGDEGEILTKGPWMFSRYLDDEMQTTKAHDEGGFFKTGDIGRREGKYYWILGRASVDILKSGGYKISALDVEREMLGLSYVQEVSVLGVDDEEFGQRIAAAVVVSKDESEVSLERIRSNLRSRLAGYKMPTLLRLVEGELPKSGTGKVVKKTLGPALFPPNYRDLEFVQVWDSRKKDTKMRQAKL